jgi:hypothetical protein
MAALPFVVLALVAAFVYGYVTVAYGTRTDAAFGRGLWALILSGSALAWLAAVWAVAALAGVAGAAF